MSARTVPAVALACALVALSGCNGNARPSGPRTPGQTAIAEGRLKLEQANMMIEGEGMVVRGRAQKARGDALVEQGKRIEGAREGRRGELLIRRGEAMIAVAREMETTLGPPAARASSAR